MRRRRVLLVAILVASLLVVAAGSFSTVRLDRGVSVGVASDDEASVGYETSDHSEVAVGDDVTLVTITNRYTRALDVTGVDVQVSVSSGGDVAFDVHPLPENIPAEGGEGGITAEVTECTPGANATVEVTVDVSSSGLSATIDGQSRPFDVRCEQYAEGDEQETESESESEPEADDEETETPDSTEAPEAVHRDTRRKPTALAVGGIRPSSPQTTSDSRPTLPRQP